MVVFQDAHKIVKFSSDFSIVSLSLMVEQHEHSRHHNYGLTSVFNDTCRYVEFTHTIDDRLVPAFVDSPSIIALPTRQLQPIILNYRRPTSRRPQYYTYTTYIFHSWFTADAGHSWPRRLMFTDAQAHASIHTPFITAYIRAPMTSSLLYIHLSALYSCIYLAYVYNVYNLAFRQFFLYTYILTVWSLMSSSVQILQFL